MGMFKSKYDKDRLMKNSSEKSKSNSTKVKSETNDDKLSHEYRRQQFIDFGRRIN